MREDAWSKGTGVCQEAEVEMYKVSMCASPGEIIRQLQNQFVKKYKVSNFLTCIIVTTCSF